MGAVFGLGGVLLMPVLAATGRPLLESWGNFTVGAYMALVPMFAGYVLFGWGLARVRASTATGLSLMETVVAAVLAVVVVGERLPVLGWVGVVMVLASLFVLTPSQPALPQPGAFLRDIHDSDGSGAKAFESIKEQQGRRRNRRPCPNAQPPHHQ
jgi:DME family drug/metabolite transporter